MGRSIVFYPLTDPCMTIKSIGFRLHRNIYYFYLSRWVHSNWNTIRALHRYKSEEYAYMRLIGAKALTHAEILHIKKTWRGIVPEIALHTGYAAFRIYKTLYGFNEFFIPSMYIGYFIGPVLNFREIKAYEHKGMLSYLFYGIPQPETVVNSINGIIFDCNSNIRPSPAEIICGCDSRMIVKPSVGSSKGANIQAIEPGMNPEEIGSLLKSYGPDYIVQKIMPQSSVTAKFNPSSLQTFRVITLFLNGRFSVCRTVMRIGMPGSIVDNFNAGGLMVKVGEDGQLGTYGYSLDDGKHVTANGHKLSGTIIPNYSAIIDMAREAHMHIPNCTIAAWDIALDAHDDPVLIEANLSYPGVFGSQLSSGSPLFGERSQEVLEYVRENKSRKVLW